MTARDFAAACVNVAQNYKTLYVMGCFGAPMTASNKARYTANHSYNKKAARTKMINAASSDTFGFDCVNLIKGLLWGWSGDANLVYGGAKYASNGVPDTNADGMILLCKDVSTDFTKIQVGEAVWLKGHIGIYIGDGLAVECTPSWKNGVQVTTVRNIKAGTGHKWTKHGKLPWLTYDSTAEPAAPAAPKAETATSLPVLKKGSKGKTVQALQVLLIGTKPGYSCGRYGADGDFGSDTEKAVIAFQRAKSLKDDGVVGPLTWAVLLGVSAS